MLSRNKACLNTYRSCNMQLDIIPQSFSTWGSLEEKGGGKVVICLRLRFESCNCMSTCDCPHISNCIFFISDYWIQKGYHKRGEGEICRDIMGYLTEKKDTFLLWSRLAGCCVFHRTKLYQPAMYLSCESNSISKEITTEKKSLHFPPFCFH